MAADNKIQVVLTPIPTVSMEDKLLVNVLVSFLPPLLDIKSPTSDDLKLIPLSQLTKPDQFKNWILGIMKGCTVKAVSADHKQTATFAYKATTIQTDVWQSLIIESVRRVNNTSPEGYKDSVGDLVRNINNDVDNTKKKYEEGKKSLDQLKKVQANLTTLLNQLRPEKTGITATEVEILTNEAKLQPQPHQSQLLQNISAIDNRVQAYTEKLEAVNGEIKQQIKSNSDWHKAYNKATTIQTRVNEIQRSQTKNSNKTTTNLVNFGDVTFSDLIGFLTNYPDLMRQAYLLHTFEADNTTDNFINSSGFVTLTLNNSTEIDAFAQPSARQAAYQFIQIKDNKGSRSRFMPALQLPGATLPAGSTPKFIGGFLNLTPESGYKLEQISLDPHEDEHTHTPYTRGFYLTVQADAQTTALSLPETLTLKDLVVGYRVDVRRHVRRNGSIIKTGNWLSLHKRAGTITINQSAISIDDEGWISPDTQAEAREVVQVFQDGSSKAIPLNIFELKRITGQPNVTQKTLCLWPPSGTSCDGKYYIEVAESNVTNGDIHWKNSNTLEVSLPLQIEKNQVELITETINRILHSKDATNNLRFLVNGFKLSCNSFGEIYYDEFVNPDGTLIFPALKLLHPPILCCLSGHSLSASTPANKKVQVETKNYQNRLPVSTHRQDLVTALNTLVNTQLQPKDESLPTLRLGDDYEVRCRAVTLDGTSLALGMELDQINVTTYSTHTVKFARQEVVSAPIFLYAEDPTLFPDDYKGSSEYVLVVKMPQSGADRSKLYNTRLIVPPAIPRQLAEWLKLMDDDQGPNAYLPNPAKFEAITAQCMPVYEPSGKVVIDKDGKVTPASATAPAENIIPVYKWKEGTGKLPGYSTPEYKKFIGLPNSEKSLPYIADPLAYDIQINVTTRNRKNQDNDGFDQHTAIDNYKGISGFQKMISEADPIKARPWQLVVQPVKKISQSKFFESLPKERIVTIYAPEGVDFEFEVKFGLNDNHPLWDVLPKKESSLFATRKFRIIHATESPLWYPHFLKSTFQGLTGELFNRLSKTPYENKLLKSLRVNNVGDESRVRIPLALRYKGFAADTLELLAEWEDVTDLPRENFTWMAIPGFESSANAPIKSNFAVTPHKKVVFDFIKNSVTSPSLLQYAMDDTGQPSDRIIYKDVDCQLIADFHLPNTKCQHITFRLASQNRFRQFFNPANQAASDPDQDNGSKRLSVIIPSSKAPLLPEVVSVQPMFAWNWPGYTVSKVNQNIQLTRQGNQIRVVLKRPWFSSGLGEKLAVVIAKEGLSVEERLLIQPFCSLWGRDATVKTDNTDTFLKGTDFRVKATNIIKQRCLDYNNDEGLTIDNILFKPNRSKVDLSQYDPGMFVDRTDIKRPFSIVSYEVSPYPYDKEKVYADIILDKEIGYTPFVRLALARYQPNAIWDEELSAVVICDFIQIWPKRTLYRTVFGTNQDITVEAQAIRTSANGKRLTYLYATYVKKEFTQLGPDEPLPSSNAGISEFTRSINFYPSTLPPDKIHPMVYDSSLSQFKITSLAIDPTKRLVIWEFESFTEMKEEALKNPFENKNLRLVFGSIVHYGN